METSEEICEALVRHVEIVGSEVFEKNFIKDGKVVCSVWCVVGDNAEAFMRQSRKWLEDNGFKKDIDEPS